MHGWGAKLGMRVLKAFGRVVVDVCLFFRLAARFGTFALLFANTMDASPRVNVVIDGPIRALSTVCQRARNFLEAWVERQVMADRVLQR